MVHDRDTPEHDNSPSAPLEHPPAEDSTHGYVPSACDIDPTAVEVALANGVACFVGSAPAVKARTADVVIANISPEAVRELAHELLRCLAPGGSVIASGFENHEVREVTSAIRAAGGDVRESYSKGAWSALVFSA